MGTNVGEQGTSLIWKQLLLVTNMHIFACRSQEFRTWISDMPAHMLGIYTHVRAMSNNFKQFPTCR